MVISEIAAATMIAVCGLQRSYRIVLYAERGVRRRIGRESPIIAGYNSFPRFFIRRVFQAGLAIALRMEGRAKTAARRAATARNSLVDGRTAMKEAVRDRRRDLRGRVLLRAAAVAVRLSRRRAKVAAHLSSRTAAIRSRVADLRATAAARRRGRQRAAAASAAASLPRPGPPPPTSSAEGAVPSPPRAGGSTGPPQQVSSSSPPPQAGQAAAAAAAATAAAAAAARPRASQRAGGRRGVHSLAGDQVAVATAAAVTVSAAVPVTRAALPLPASGGWGRVGRPLVGQPPSLVGLSALLHPAPCGVLSRSGPGPSRLAQQPGVDT
ncbi:hypothetical protein I4F81_006548 [Pyropia yezoensis]|uniref:Uncharacterized protein n=1 Tax=Pyropia yezoensis TaxID=2788 RepID=A0ACC3C208_PYRYE|nr:hypothetical protein I4F81_006548 [Neopyropia yezoensis]